MIVNISVMQGTFKLSLKCHGLVFSLLSFLWMFDAPASGAILDEDPLPNEVRFLVQGQIQRLDLRTGKWLAAVKSSTDASSIAWDSIHQFTLSANGVTRSDSGGGNSQSFLPADPSFRHLYLSGQTLYVTTGSSVLSFDRYTKVKLAEINLGQDLDTIRWKSTIGGSEVIGLRTDGGRGKLFKLKLSPRGSVLSQLDVLVNASGTSDFWPSRGGGRVWISNGTLWDTAAGERLADLGTTISCAAFYTLEQFAVVSGDKLLFVDVDGTVSASQALKSIPSSLFTQGGNLFLVRDTGKKPSLETKAWNSFSFTQSEVAPPDRNAPYSTTPVFVRGGREIGIVRSGASGYYLDRWSPEDGDYLASIRLPDNGTLKYHEPTSRLIMISNWAPPTILTAPFSIRPQWTTVSGYDLSDAKASTAALTDRSLLLGGNDSTDYRELDLTTLTWSATTFSKRLNSVWNDTAKALFSEDVSSLEITTRNWGDSSRVTPPSGDRLGSNFARVSEDGRRVVVSSGYVFLGLNSQWRVSGDLGQEIVSAAWRDDSLLVTQRPDSNGDAVLERREGRNLKPLEPGIVLPGGASGLFRLKRGFAALFGRQGVLGVLELGDDGRITREGAQSPLPPGGLLPAGATSTSVTLLWQPLGLGGDAVRLAWRPYSTRPGKWTFGPLMHPAQTSATVGGLKAGTTYEFQILGIRRNQTASSSSVYQKTPSPKVVDGSPYDLRLEFAVKGEVRIRWEDRLPNESGFVVRRTTETMQAAATEFRLPPDTVQFTDQSVQPGVTYYYWVTAISSSGKGVLSNWIRVGTFTDALPPDGTITLRLNRKALFTNHLDWLRSQDPGVESYIIQRLEDSEGIWQDLAVVSSEILSYDDPIDFPGLTYRYRVVPQNRYGRAMRLNESSGYSVPQFGLPGNDAPCRVGDVVYFIDPVLDEVERFQVSTGTWLTPLRLSLLEEARTWTVTARGIFVATNYTVSRMALDGSGTEVLYTGRNQIREIWQAGDKLYFGMYSFDPTVACIDLTGSAPIKLSTVAVVYDVSATSEAGNITYNSFNAMFGGAMTVMEHPGDGSVRTLGHSNTRHAVSRLWVFPDGQRAIDDQGDVYLPNSALYTILNRKVDDCHFLADGGFVILSKGSLRVYSPNFQLISTFAVSPLAFSMHADGGRLVLLSMDRGADGNFRSTSVTFDSIGLPGEGVSPRAIAAGMSTTNGIVSCFQTGNLVMIAGRRIRQFTPGGDLVDEMEVSADIWPEGAGWACRNAVVDGQGGLNLLVDRDGSGTDTPFKLLSLPGGSNGWVVRNLPRSLLGNGSGSIAALGTKIRFESGSVELSDGVILSEPDHLRAQAGLDGILLRTNVESDEHFVRSSGASGRPFSLEFLSGAVRIADSSAGWFAGFPGPGRLVCANLKTGRVIKRGVAMDAREPSFPQPGIFCYLSGSDKVSSFDLESGEMRSFPHGLAVEASAPACLVAVCDVSNLPTEIHPWAARFTSAILEDLSSAVGDLSPGDDADGDGLSDWLEFCLGSDRLVSGDSAPVIHRNGPMVEWLCPSRIDPETGYPVVQFEFSTDLVHWSIIPPSGIISRKCVGPDRFKIIADSRKAPKLFIRCKAPTGVFEQ